MVLSPEGRGIFGPEPTIPLRYHQWTVLAVVTHTFVCKVVTAAMHHSSWLLGQLKSSTPPTFSEQTTCVQLNENMATTTEKHWQRELHIPKFRSHRRMRKRRRESWAELWVILQRPGGSVYQQFSLDSGIIQWPMLSSRADYLEVNVLLNLMSQSK